MSAKILKAFSLGLWIIALEVLVSSCAMNLSSPQESTDHGTVSTQGGGTIADNSTPSGQGTQEGHGEGDFATLIINGILSQEDADRLANSNVVSALFTTAMQSGPAPLMDGDWTQMGGWSSPDLSIIFSDSPRRPPPHMRDYCLYPYLRFAGLYEVKTEKDGVIHYEYYMSPWVLQDCPKDINLFRMNLPLALQCQDCGPPKDATLKVQAALSEEDAARLASSNVTQAVFGVTVESGPDPSSESDWTLMGTWDPSGLSLTFSDAFGALPPSLSEICLFPYVRLTGAYKVGIETIDGSQTEFYKSPPVVQACPTDWDVAQVTLPLILCKDCVPKTPPGLTVQGILSEADLARLANSTISKSLFSVSVETASDPNSERNWSSVGSWSSSSRSITFSSLSDAPPPYLSDICLEPYVRLTPTLKMDVEINGVIQTEFYQGPPVIQKCPGSLDSVLVPLPLELQCSDCGGEETTELIMEGVLSAHDSKFLSHFKAMDPLFKVVIESSPNPTSQDNWTRVGELSSSTLFIRVSDSMRTHPPHLKDLCLYPFLRLTGTYELKIEEGRSNHVEYFKSLPIIQDCPRPSDQSKVSLPLEHQRNLF